MRIDIASLFVILQGGIKVVGSLCANVPVGAITLKRARKMSRDNENGKYIFPVSRRTSCPPTRAERYALTCR